MADPIRKLVQLVLDKRAAAKVEADAKKALGGVNKAMASLKRAALSLGTALVAAFSVRAITRFGKETIRVAKEAEAIWNRLAQAVENVGVSFAEARPEVDAFARAMQDVTTVGDEDFAAILTELITTSGDYAASLREVGTVADLAAAKQIDFKTAAQLVGRAMVGQTGTLTRYGIVVEEGQDAMEVLRQTFRGFAANEARSMEGRLKQLNNEWSDFKQAVGDALLVAGGGTSIIESLTTSLKVLTDWINSNTDAFKTFGDAIAALQDPLIRLLETLGKYLRFLETVGEMQRGAVIGGGPAGDIVGFFIGGKDGVEKKILQVRRMADAIDDLVARMNDAQRRREAGIQLPPPPRPRGGRPAPSGAPGGGQEDVEQAIDDALTLEQIWQRYPAVMLQVADQMASIAAQEEGWAGLNSEMEMSEENAAKLAEQLAKVAETAQMGQREMMLMGQAGVVAGDLAYGVLSGRLDELAAAKAKQNAIMAAEQAAMGFVASLNPVTAPLAAGHYAAAKLFAGIAAAWGALAAATGGFSGGGGGGGRGGPSDTGGAASERAEAPGPEIHIHFVGPGFTAVNPAVQDVVYGAAQEAASRYGPNATVKTHRRPRG
jgi:hypothetical protein